MAYQDINPEVKSSGAMNSLMNVLVIYHLHGNNEQTQVEAMLLSVKDATVRKFTVKFLPPFINYVTFNKVT